jgi:hypothetical protein
MTMRATIAICTVVISLGLAGLAVSTHGDSAPIANEQGALPRAAVMDA